MISTMTGSARLSLNEHVDQASLNDAQVDALFAVADALAEQPPLRRALSDPGIEASARAELARRLLEGKVDAKVADVVSAAAAEAWPNEDEFVAGVLDQAVRAGLRNSCDPSLIARQLYSVGQLVKNNPELTETLRNQRIPLAQRRELLGGLLGEQVAPLTKQLAHRAVSDAVGRANSVPALIRHFLEVGARAFGRTLAQAASAKAMSEAQSDELRRQLERIYDTEIFLVTDVDPELLGGVRVEVGDEVIDGTVRARLDQVHHELKLGD